jgi:hypothetical protein
VIRSRGRNAKNTLLAVAQRPQIHYTLAKQLYALMQDGV